MVYLKFKLILFYFITKYTKQDLILKSKTSTYYVNCFKLFSPHIKLNHE